MVNILIVEDEKDLLELFSAVLSNNGYKTITAKDGKEALNIIENENIDMIITDIMMPNINGFELVEMLRESKFMMPILAITAKSQFKDVEYGFNIGIDDYMVKPINISEMLLRVKALLRRSRIVNSKEIIIGNTKINEDKLCVTWNNNEVFLPQKEFAILFKLLSYQGKIFTRRQLLEDIWGVDFEGDSHTLDVHIERLRKKFSDNNDFEIVTIRGLGYKAVKK